MAGFRFSGGHLWTRLDGDHAVLGLTDYLQDQLGDIVALDLPDVGDLLRAEARMGGVQADLASTSLSSPVTGEVIDVNPEILESPDLVNQEPYDGGWLLRVRLDNPSELDGLMSEEEYMDLTTEV